MTTVEANITITEIMSPPLQTKGASHDELSSTHADGHNRSQKWDFWIDNYLVEWGRNPSLFDTTEIKPPSKSIIHLACRLARESRDAGLAPPLRIVPDGEGGISFERKSESGFQSLNFLAEGIVELLTFQNSKLVARENFSVPPLFMD